MTRGYKGNVRSYVAPGPSKVLPNWVVRAMFRPRTEPQVFNDPQTPDPNPPVAENLPPEITSTPVTEAIQDEAYAYDVQGTDPEGQELFWSLIEAPDGMTINEATGVISWTPDDTQLGSNTVTVRLTDVGGLFDEQNFTIEVSAPPPSNYCAVFNGTSAYLSFVDDGSLDSLTELTIEGWAAIGEAGTLYIAAEDEDEVQYEFQFVRGGGSELTLAGNPGLNGGTWADLDLTWPDDEDVHHFCVSLFSDGTARIRLDGVASDMSRVSGSGAAESGTVLNFYIGTIPLGSVFSPLPCCHRISMRDQSVDDSEAEDLFELGPYATSVGIASTPVFELLLANDVQDSSGNNRDFTNNGVTFVEE